MRSRVIAFALLIGCGPGISDGGGEGGSEAGTTADGPACDDAFDSGLAFGQPIWTQTFERGVASLATGVAVDAAGVVYAAGFFSHDATDSDAWLFAFAPDSRVLWMTEHPNEPGLAASFHAIALAPTGDIVVLGRDEVQIAPDDTRSIPNVATYTAEGALVWRTQLPESVSAVAIAVRSDGRVIVGASEGSLGFERLILCQLDAAGQSLGCEPFVLDEYQRFVIGDLAVDADGRLHVVAQGSPIAEGDPHEWLGRWDVAGSFLGALVHAHAGADPVGVAPWDGGALVLGSIEIDLDERVTRPLLRRYDANDAELWSYQVELDGEDSARPLGLELDCEGNAIIVAYTNDQDWLFKVDVDGAELARSPLAVEPDVYTYDTATDPFGNLVIAGIANSGQNGAFAVHELAR